MGRENAKATNPHLIPLLYAPEDTEEPIVEIGSGAEEIAPLDGPAGDEDEGRLGGRVDEAKFSSHAP